MIFTGIAIMLANVFQFFVLLFPDANSTMVTNIHGSLHNAMSLIAPFNWIFPAQEFLTYLSFLLFAGMALVSVRLGRWIASILTANLFH